MRLHAPHSVEGRQVWDLMLRCGRQIRAVPGRVIGYDMAAVFMMGDAMGVPRAAVAEFLPRIEAVAMTAINEAADQEIEGVRHGTA